MYISLTTIPSRLTRTVERTLTQLLKQNTPVTQILLTVPRTNMRGQPCTEELPAFLSQPPLADRVQVVRPAQDLGPVMKYLGVVHAAHVPDDAWIWVCDDDQLYKPDCIARCWAHNAERDPRVVVAVRGRTLFLTPTPQGYAGVLLHRSVIQRLHEYVQQHGIPPSCVRIDDNFVGFVLKKCSDVTVKLMPAEHRSWFETGTPLPENADALHTSHVRAWAQMQCACAVDGEFQTLMIVVLVISVVVLVWGGWLWWRSSQQRLSDHQKPARRPPPSGR